MNTLWDLLSLLLDALGLLNRASDERRTSQSAQDQAEYEVVERDYEYDER